MRPLRLKQLDEVVFSYLFFRYLYLKGFNHKRGAYVLRFLLVKERQKKKQTNKQKTSEVFLSISLEWLNNALFGKEIAVGLGLGLFRNALS